MSTVRLIVSGKGGVGKSTIAANLGLALGKLGRRVCVVDLDIGLRDLDAILGLEDSVVYDLMDVVCQGCELPLALLPVPGAESVSLLPASQFARQKDLEPKALRKVIRQLRERFDEILLDCPAGVERWVRNAAACGVDQTLLVVTPDDVCIRDAQRTGDVLNKKNLPSPSLLVNRLDPELILAKEMMSAKQVADVLDLPLVGEIPEDPQVYRALLRHARLMDTDSPASEALTRIALRLTGQEAALPRLGLHRSGWFHRLFSSLKKEGKSIVDRIQARPGAH